jgi:toxin ParE1/3/4
MISLNRFKPIKISKPAEEDLKEIADYTLKQWGGAQRKAYLDLFKHFFKRLSRGDRKVCLLLKDREDIDVGLQSFTIKKHVVFLRVTEHEISIVRVLHSRMDHERHLHK